jgi:hypothetical protein
MWLSIAQSCVLSNPPYKASAFPHRNQTQLNQTQLNPKYNMPSTDSMTTKERQEAIEAKLDEDPKALYLIESAPSDKSTCKGLLPIFLNEKDLGLPSRRENGELNTTSWQRHHQKPSSLQSIIRHVYVVF